ncbi:phosphonopyruvate hydrolase [Streptomyces albiaxialis]|uniref:Phosphonopyruvate hydrolase n=1 Tax=Streptomyces albiaxialis TaxID=329523 RepID=A0ABP5HSM0_9ACTN
MTRTTTLLRQLLNASRLTKAVGAHNALTARIVEETGFDCVWASGFEVSTSHCVPDSNVLTMSECLSAAQDMARAVEIPVLADCDSGFGGVNNVFHMVRQYEAGGIAGVCIEDKQFPKMNSFVESGQTMLAAEDFAARIQAAKHAQVESDFVVVARIESFISGAGTEDAIYRARVYECAGADALLIHSKERIPRQVNDFRENYSGGLPVIVVPTTYPEVTVDELEAKGFAMAIYANHGLRRAIKATREAMVRIQIDGTTKNVEEELAPLSEVFALQGMPESLKRQLEFEESGRTAVSRTGAPGGSADPAPAEPE